MSCTEPSRGVRGGPGLSSGRSAPTRPAAGDCRRRRVSPCVRGASPARSHPAVPATAPYRNRRARFGTIPGREREMREGHPGDEDRSANRPPPAQAGLQSPIESRSKLGMEWVAGNYAPPVSYSFQYSYVDGVEFGANATSVALCRKTRGGCYSDRRCATTHFAPLPASRSRRSFGTPFRPQRNSGLLVRRPPCAPRAGEITRSPASSA